MVFRIVQGFKLHYEQVEREIQEIAGLYRACPEQGRRLILTAIRAMAKELMEKNER